MSRDKGNRAPHWVAAYLRPWWPSVEVTPNSRKGRDLTGTPPVVVEIKTGATWSHKAIAQVAGYAGPGELPLVVYLPPGCGEAQVSRSLVVVPLGILMPVLVAAGYAPDPEEGSRVVPR